MRMYRHTTKCAVCVLMVLMLLVSTLMCTVSSFSAQEIDEAQTAADTYYFWGENSNGPNFNGMSAPTGQFTYDSAKGYYYYDITSFGSGDYCFVISTNNSSGSQAVNSQAVTTAQSSGEFYLTRGNYSGYSCFHIWNNDKAPVRIYFNSASSGCNAVKMGSEPTQQPTTQTPTQKPTTTPTTPTPTTPTSTPTTSPSGEKMVYLKNSAGWGSPCVYMWKDGAGSNKGWPGANMENIGDDVWQYIIPGDYDKIIFNNSGQSQTSDMSFPGNGYIYDNSTNKWDIYDVSPIQVKSFKTDLQSPQYTGMDIVISAVATGDGDVFYRFSVAKGSASPTVISDYSLDNSAVWTPSSTGTYTLTADFKDSKGNTNTRSISFEVDDPSSLESPIIKSVTPSDGQQIIKDKECNVSVSAGGGNTGTKLLFYKYTVKDSTGATVNVPYYSLSSSYKFTPTKLGTYSLVVSVQSSDNSEVAREYTLDCVNSIDPTTKLKVSSLTTTGELKTDNQIKISASATGGIAPYTYKFAVGSTVIKNYSASNTCDYTFTQKGDYTITVYVTDTKGETATRSIEVTVADSGSPETRTLRGDSDRDGYVTVVDATYIQKWLAFLTPASELNMANADADDNGTVDIIDATLIQKYLAGYHPW